MDTSILVIWIGAIMVVSGMLYMAGAALWQRRLSGPARTPEGQPRGTLEPSRHGMKFLGLTRNWPGLALFAGGALLLLFGAAL